MKTVINSQTGLEEVQFSAKVLSISENELSYTNAQNVEKFYRLATIEFVDNDGTVQEASATIPAANYAYGMEVGKTYLATAKADTTVNAQPGDVIINVSHLTQTPVAPRAKANMFGKAFVNRLQEVTA
jgi:hypothetical protein